MRSGYIVAASLGVIGHLNISHGQAVLIHDGKINILCFAALEIVKVNAAACHQIAAVRELQTSHSHTGVVVSDFSGNLENRGILGLLKQISRLVDTQHH